MLLRVSRAAWRLEEAERERSWALASARAEGVSIRALAAAVGLSSSRVHQIVAAADLDELGAALGELRAAGWPAPDDPGDLAAAVLPGRRAERRRRVAGPDLDFREFCRGQKVSASSERSWDACEAERYRRGERDTHPGYTENPFRTARQRV